MTIDFKKILESKDSLSPEEKVQILAFLDSNNLSVIDLNNNDEVIAFIEKHIDALNTWDSRLKSLLQKNKEFFNELSE